MARVDTIKLIGERERELNSSTNTITIELGDGTSITGNMTSEFGFELTAEWEQLLSMSGFMETGQKFMQAIGSPAFTTGIFTRKFYKGGSYFNFNVDFRIVDWDGDVKNKVVVAARRLSDLLLPIKRSSSSFANELENLKATGSSLVGGIMDGSVKNESQLLSKLGKSGVGAVRVTIGNYFTGDLIVESMSVKYSKEKTMTGPLYGDFTVGLSTIEILGKGNAKLLDGKRVTFKENREEQRNDIGSTTR